MKYEAQLTKEAESYLKRLDKLTRERISRRIDELQEDPYVHSKTLTGTDSRSSRVGDYRILFDIYQDQLIVLVFAIGSRGQVYREL